MNDKPKYSKHFLADKIPLILAAVLMLAVSMLPSMGLELIIEPFYNESNGLALQMLWCIGQIIITVLLMVLFEKWFVPEYEGSMGSKGFSYGLKLSLPVLIFWTVWISAKALMKLIDLYPPDFESIVKGLRPGVSEEIAFRGIAVALLLRRYRKPQNIWVPVVFTSVFFGLTHITNIKKTEDVMPMLLTSVFAIVFGIILGVIFTLSGCIWPTVIVHSLYDIALICSDVPDTAPDWPIFVDVGGTVVLMVLFLLFFLRRKSNASALWNTKWHNPLP